MNPTAKAGIIGHSQGHIKRTGIDEMSSVTRNIIKLPACTRKNISLHPLCVML
jgi:hypothetical protein